MFQDETPGQRWLWDMDLIKDPHVFSFALVCGRCRDHCTSLQAMRQHVPTGIELICGHCDKLFTSWPKFVEHINSKDMHLTVACQPWCAVPRSRPLDIQASPLQPSTQAYSRMSVQGCTYNSLECCFSPDILALAVEAAGLWTPAVRQATSTTRTEVGSVPPPDQAEVQIPPPTQVVVVPFLEDGSVGQREENEAEDFRSPEPPPLPVPVPPLQTISIQRNERAQASAGEVAFVAFDMDKTLPLPKLAVGEAFYL